MKRFILLLSVFCVSAQASCNTATLSSQRESTNKTVQTPMIVQPQQQTNQLSNDESEADSQNDNTYIYKTPGGVNKKIVFPRGRTSTTVGNRVVRMDKDVYTVSASENQQMSVSIKSIENNASFYVHSSDDTNISGENDVKSWSGKLPATGDYTIKVGATRGNATYKLKISVK